MRTRSRIIYKNDAETAGRWDFPAVDATAADALRGAAKGSAHVLTAGQLEALERQAQEEARQKGYAEGLAAGKAEATAQVARLTSLATAFTHPFLELEQAVEDEIVKLAIKLACHLVRREIEHDPALLHAAVADCLAALAANVRDVKFYFSPDDAALLTSLQSGERRFEIAVDPELERGDLRVASESSLVDGTLAARCAEIIAAGRAAAESQWQR
jgi:flagellar assembly protein FliH